MSLPADFDSRPAAEKLELLWKNVTADPYAEGALPTRPPGVWGRRKLFSVAFNRGSFEIPGDEVPPDRPKLVHTYGAVGRVTMKITAAHPYTGVFERGGAGLLRFSDAKGGGTFVPSLALKLPVDGRPERPEVPDRVELHPTTEGAAACWGAPDFRLSLSRIPAGTRLFELRAAPRKDAEATPMGELWLDSAFIASRYGDERLFFQHDVGPTA